MDKNSFVDTPIVKSEITYYFEQDSIIDGINFYIEGMRFEKVTLTYQVYTKRKGYGFVEGQGYLIKKLFQIEYLDTNGTCNIKLFEFKKRVIKQQILNNSFILPILQVDLDCIFLPHEHQRLD